MITKNLFTKIHHILFFIFEVLSGRALYLGQKPIEMLSMHSLYKKKRYHTEHQKHYISFYIWKSRENKKKSMFFFAFLIGYMYNYGGLYH